MADANASSSLTTSSPARAVSAAALDCGSILYVWEPMAAVVGYIPADDWGEFMTDGGFLTWDERLNRGKPLEQVPVDYTRTYPGCSDWAGILSLYQQRLVDSLTGPVPGITTLLDDLLGRGVTLYGLTNFDAAPFRRARLLVSQLERFVDIVVSGREHLTKPDAVVFDLLLSCYRLQTLNTLFVDDSAVNIEATGRLGMHTHHFTGVGQLRSELIAPGLLSMPDRH